MEGDKWGQMEAKRMDPDGSARHMDPRKQDTTNNEKEVSGWARRMDPEAWNKADRSISHYISQINDKL